jgi:quinol monooxygenase YgiN
MKIARGTTAMSSSSQKIIPILASMALGAALYHAVYFVGTKKLSSGRRERIPGNAWTLTVTLTFTSEEDQRRILEEWRPVTKYCADKEPFLHHYEVGRSDDDPLKVYIVERYESKEDYLTKHKTGEEFLKFRPKLMALQDAGKVKVEGFSYQELGYGFV